MAWRGSCEAWGVMAVASVAGMGERVERGRHPF